MQTIDSLTIEQQFIRKLLQSNHIPIIPTLSDGDMAVSGVEYVYKNNIIRCNLTGRISSTSYNFCSNDILCGPDIICGIGIRSAIFDVMDTFDPEDFTPGLTTNFVSSSNLYNRDTHKHLGKYLRWYRSYYGIDLMPLYNCYAKESTQMIHLKDGKFSDGPGVNTNVWLVPVELNRTYTIYMDTNSKISIRGTFLNECGRLTTSTSIGVQYVDTLIDDRAVVYHGSSYSNPITYSVITTDPNVMSFNKYFYLAIQTDTTYDGNIVVLEGDYKNIPSHFTMSGELGSDDDYENFKLKVKPSLSIMPSKKYQPYSDALIGYLLQSVITSNEDVSENISRVQEALGITKKIRTQGIWDNLTRYAICHKYFRRTSNSYIKDHSEESINRLLTTVPKDNLVDVEYEVDGNKMHLMGTKNMKPRLIPHRNVCDKLGYVDKDVEELLQI